MKRIQIVENAQGINDSTKFTAQYLIMQLDKAMVDNSRKLPMLPAKYRELVKVYLRKSSTQ